jgi:hypothetical protein
MSEYSQSLSDAYFTPPASVEFVHKTLEEHGWLGGTILEPCCGEGYLVKGLDRVTCWDLNQYNHPLDWVGNFLERDPEPYNMVLTNPPFGWLGGLACDILNHATKFTNRVAIILPQCFRKVQRIDRINPHFHPVVDLNLPDETYLLPTGERKYVRTCFQMWEWRDYKRKKFGTTPYTEFFTQVPKEEAEYYLRTQGSTAGQDPGRVCLSRRSSLQPQHGTPDAWQSGPAAGTRLDKGRSLRFWGTVHRSARHRLGSSLSQHRGVPGAWHHV